MKIQIWQIPDFKLCLFLLFPSVLKMDDKPVETKWKKVTWGEALTLFWVQQKWWIKAESHHSPEYLS